ncbi:CACTA en-spm transposon protein [Cucumis melo var. makuwa]|uniref:CACTA en-spm transposon protein n=1 Tax=Cucumis melo var. makuwa TaxID=1194695 RepID=A0A5A7V980_CUCMM|nr:CACTA en-spm transposon protein [Cucumis melo var. makuwa]TYK05512.1 CACTA en-spm transposon protein [Cucumis melo var. makuwa]
MHEHIEDDTLCRPGVDPTESYIQKNEKSPISITLGAEKPTSLHVVWFSNTIDVLTEDTVSIRCLTWVDVPPEYIEVVKGGLQEKSRTKKATRAKQSYNHNSESKSFLQQQHELTKQQGQPVDRVKLFQKTNANMSGQFISQVAVDVHSQPTPEGSQSLSGDKMCETIWSRRSDYSKGLGWDSKPKSRKSTSSYSSSYPQETHPKEVNKLSSSFECSQ